MNERILLNLFVRSGLEAYIPVEHFGDQIKVQKHIEKFAELIVRECARVYWRIDDGELHGEYVKALKEHFGVE